MKVKRMFVYITFIVGVISLLGVIFLSSGFVFYEISLGILSGSIVGLIMTLTEYFVERRKAMWNFYQAGRKMEEVLSFGEHGAYSLMYNAPLDLIHKCVGYRTEGVSNKEKIELIDYAYGGFGIEFYQIHFGCIESADVSVAINDEFEDAIVKIRTELMITLNHVLEVSKGLRKCELEDTYENLGFLFWDINKKYLHHRKIYQIYNETIKKLRVELLEWYAKEWHDSLERGHHGSYSNVQHWSRLLKELKEYFFLFKEVSPDYYDYDEIIRDEINEHLQKFRKRMNWVKEK